MKADAKDFSYRRRQPEKSILYKTLACHLNTFLANLAEEGQWLPKHVEKELWAYLSFLVRISLRSGNNKKTLVLRVLNSIVVIIGIGVKICSVKRIDNA